MKRRPTNLLMLIVSASLAISFSIVALETLLFKTTDYNVYRVLDISSQGVLLLFTIVFIQYLLFRFTPLRIKNNWTSSKLLKTYWPAIVISGLSLVGLFSFIPTKSSIGTILLMLAGFMGYIWLVYNYANKPFQKIILLILFGAGLNASFIFWLHEEENSGIHIKYARELAEKRDTIAENQLSSLFIQEKANQRGEADDFFWERQWLNNEYLSSNYQFIIQKTKTGSARKYYQPALTFDESSTPVYSVNLPSGIDLLFKLKKDFWKSVYTVNQAYKNLEQLNDFHFAVVDSGAIVMANSHKFDKYINALPLPPVGIGKKIEQDGFDGLVYHHSENVFVLIGEPLSPVFVWFSNYTFFFILFIAAAIIKKLLFLVILKKNYKKVWRGLPIQFRMQAYLMALTLTIFSIISSTTIIFLHQNNLELSYERQENIVEIVRKVVLKNNKYYGWELADFPVGALAEISDRKKCEIDFYDVNGQLLVSSIASATNSPAAKNISNEVLNEIKANPVSIVINEFQKQDKPYFRSVFGILENREVKGFVAISAFNSEIGTAQDIPVIMSKLLNVYVLLLILTLGIGFLVINLLTKPLNQLAVRLSQFKPGKVNEKLDWQGNDVIGRLIREYNTMVDVVELTTQELVRDEKENAWQIMAQQISHEINNTLTPLRLNIQFLTRMLNSPQHLEVSKAEHFTNRIITQVDNLAQVATQFKFFAKLDIPAAKSLELKPFLGEFFQAMQERNDLTYNLITELDDDTHPVIFIDRQHLNHILENILIYISNSIPESKEDSILIRLTNLNGRAIIEVKDNGKGINSGITENIFDPSFSTNSSQTGLGLPICKRIVEFHKGDLSVSSQDGVGTCFKISFPIIRSIAMAV